MANSNLLFDDKLAGVLCRGFVGSVFVYGFLGFLEFCLSFGDLRCEFLVMFQCTGNGSLTGNSAIRAQSNNEISNWACHGDIVCLIGAAVSVRGTTATRKSTYDEKHSSTTHEVSLETFLDDPPGRVHVQRSEHLSP